jgi:hypothetical protein
MTQEEIEQLKPGDLLRIEPLVAWGSVGYAVVIEGHGADVSLSWKQRPLLLPMSAHWFEVDPETVQAAFSAGRITRIA